MRHLRRKQQRKARNASKTQTKSNLKLESLEHRLLLSAATDYLRITEIMYNPPGQSDDLQFIELQNISDTETLQLQGVKFTRGISYTFPNHSLGPKGFVLVVKNPTAFEVEYGAGLPVINPVTGFGNVLDDDGERLEIKDAGGVDILDFRYNYDENLEVYDEWYPITDGDGFTLTIVDATADTDEWDNRKGWRPSSKEGGTPGAVDFVERKVVINEILTHTDGVLGDWIELFNETSNPVSIGGWYLSDNPNNLTKYQIPAGTEIPENGYVVFNSIEHFGNTGDPDKDFGLSEFGETVHLTEVNDQGEIEGFFEEKIFGASEREVSFGRFEKSVGTFGFVAMKENTPNMSNSDPKVDPVVISEIMYNPASDNSYHEYMKLTNITGLPALLEREVTFLDQDGKKLKTESVPWKFTDGIDYTFPAGTTIPAYGSVIVASNKSAFTSYYGSLPSGVLLLGPFTSGKLSNQGEGVEISIPNDETPPGMAEVQYIVKDRVRYDDNAPWPTEPDGGGQALVRIDDNKYANDPINWKAGNPLNWAPIISTFTDSPDPVIFGEEDLTLTADVSDSGDVITRVEFYHDSDGDSSLDPVKDTLLKADTNGADGWSWTGSTASFDIGNNRYFVRARDDDGVWSRVSATIGRVNSPPTIGSLDDDPDPVSQSSTLTLTASNVADTDGTIAFVEFYRDSNTNEQFDEGVDAILGTDNDGGDGWSWSNTPSIFSFPLGLNRYFARARDGDGAWSNVVETTGSIEPPNTPPTIGSLIDSPDPVLLGATLTLTANNVNDTDGNVVAVAFFRDANGNAILDPTLDQLLDFDINGADGWSITKSTAAYPSGINTYFAQARDDKNDWSNVVSTTGEVESPNVSPVVASLSDNPDPIIEGHTLTLTAAGVNDEDGTIASVEFYHDSNGNGALDIGIDDGFDDLLGVGTKVGDDWVWSGSTAGYEVGEHRFFARAQDNKDEWSNTVDTTTQVDSSNVAPTVGSLSDNPDPVVAGNDMTLTANGAADTDGTITTVEFYRDGGNGVFEPGTDELLGTDTNGADGWNWTVTTTELLLGESTYFTRVQDDLGVWSDSVSTTNTVEPFSIMAGQADSMTVAYIDASGSEVAVKFKNVEAKLYFEGVGLTTQVNGSTTIIVGATELDLVEMTQTSAGASLTLTVKNGQADLGGITGGSLDKLTGKYIDLEGDINLTGYLGAVTLNDIEGDVTVTTQQASPKGFSLKADRVKSGAIFDLNDTVKKFQVIRFTEGSLLANHVNKVTTKEGVFGADVIARNGDILNVSAVDDITGQLNASNMIKKVVTKAGNFTGVARAGNTIGTIQAMNLNGAIISAGETVKKVNIKNNISLSYILGGYDIGSDGLFGTGDILGSGSVLAVTAKGTFDQSYVAAGVLPSTPDTDFLLGVGVPEDFGEIGKVSFGIVDPISSDDFGIFAATNIKSVKVKDGPSETESQFIVEDMNG
jgi:lamin tail-like protein/Big-like domain-containing protein